MNPQPEIGTIEHCKLVLAEWKAKAEASEKERAELVERLKEAVWLIKNHPVLPHWVPIEEYEWCKRRDAFLTSQKEEK